MIGLIVVLGGIGIAIFVVQLSKIMNLALIWFLPLVVVSAYAWGSFCYDWFRRK